jgi:hypothetical protein
MDEHIFVIDDVPDDYKLGDAQELQVCAHNRVAASPRLPKRGPSCGASATRVRSLLAVKLFCPWGGAT